jgi:dihydrofolate reductase
MGKFVVSENTSIDGGVQDPTGEEGFPRGGWFAQMSTKDREEWAQVQLDELQRAQAVLLGRRSYEFFASRWPSRGGELADRFNSMPKYVVSATLDHPAWNNSTVLNGHHLVPEVEKLKQTLDGDVVIYASAQLVWTLIERDLVDELRLMVYPVVLGAGRRLFGEISDTRPMRLLDARTIGDNLALLTYERLRAA